MRYFWLFLLAPLAVATAYGADVSPAEVEQLIQAFGPVMKLEPTERYLMDDPGYVLNSGKVSLQWGIVHHENDYDTFAIEGLQTAALASEADLAGTVAQAKRDPRAGKPDFRYWLHLDDSLLAGDQTRGKAWVTVVQAPDRAYLDLQFWFFYPFNGPGKFRVTIGKLVDDHVILKTCGRHYGDWEHVTLRLERSGQPAELPWRLVDVYLSRHAISKWQGGLAGLRFLGRHPIVYIGRDSHAHYPGAGIQYYRRLWSSYFLLGSAAMDLEDWTGNGPTFDAWQPGNYQIVASHAAPAWYAFDGAWGQYEKLIYTYGPGIYTYKEIGSGPHGPAFHGPD